MSPAPCLISVLVIAALASAASAQLSPTFYDTSCPTALATIKNAVEAAVRNNSRAGAWLLRLHFHDCFVDGCDASVLLADTESFVGEQGAFPNRDSLRGLDIVDSIKALVERQCPQNVSCADILAIAARDSVELLGGPSWTVLLGRRDSLSASTGNANRDLPSPSSNLTNLTKSFTNKGLNLTDMVALSGAHTIGQAQCRFFRDRVYNDKNIDATFAASLQGQDRCPRANGAGDGNLAPLDAATPTWFDNAYFRSLMNRTGLLHSDQELFNGGGADSIVQSFASNVTTFNSAFVTAMVKMGNIGPLTGTQGQIRLSCSPGEQLAHHVCVNELCQSALRLARR